MSKRGGAAYPAIMKYRVHTDGAARGNPGPAAIGIVVQDDAGHTVYEASRSIGTKTNNEAEYLALIAALEYLKDSRMQEADFFLDSELVVKQLNGVYRVKEPRMQSLHARVTMLLNAVPRHSFKHVRREENARADALANEALDAEGGPRQPA